MAAPLSLLRDFYIRKKEIIESNGNIIFGDVVCHKEMSSSILTFRSVRNEGPKEYYSLESVLFFLKNANLRHNEYARKAVERNIPMIDNYVSADLLAYINGDIESSEYIDCTTTFNAPACHREVEGTSTPVKKKLYPESELNAGVIHFGETVVNDIKEEVEQMPVSRRFGETVVFDGSEDFFQLHYGETIVNDCSEGSVRVSKKKRRTKTSYKVKDDPDVIFCVPEKKKLRETFIFDVKD